MSERHPFTRKQLDDIAGGLVRMLHEYRQNAVLWPKEHSRRDFWIAEAKRIDATLDLVEGMIKRREYRNA